MVSEVLVVYLGQTSKPIGMIIIPDYDTDNQPVHQRMGGYNNWNFSLNVVGIGL